MFVAKPHVRSGAPGAAALAGPAVPPGMAGPPRSILRVPGHGPRPPRTLHFASTLATEFKFRPHWAPSRRAPEPPPSLPIPHDRFQPPRDGPASSALAAPPPLLAAATQQATRLPAAAHAVYTGYNAVQAMPLATGLELGRILVGWLAPGVEAPSLGNVSADLAFVVGSFLLRRTVETSLPDLADFTLPWLMIVALNREEATETLALGAYVLAELYGRSQQHSPAQRQQTGAVAMTAARLAAQLFIGR